MKGGRGVNEASGWGREKMEEMGRGRKGGWKIGIVTRFNTPRQLGYVMKRLG